MRGFFITFEGADGGGKTTQLRLAAEALRAQGYEVVESREPGGTPLAEKVRALVLDPQLPLTSTSQTLLYLAARSEHVDKVLRPALETGKIVLCDRFSDSTLVTAGIKPDLTLVLDGDPELLATRRELRGVTDRYEEKGLEYQKILRQGFLTLAKAEPARMKVINAEDDTASVAALIQKEIAAFLAEAK